MYRLSAILMLLTLAAPWAGADLVFQDVTPNLPHFEGSASCVAWGDVNNDGWPDLFIGGLRATASCLYINLNGTFIDATAHYEIPLEARQNIRTAQFVDFDGDGLLDLYTLTDDTDGIRVLRQTPDGRYEVIRIFEGSVSSPIRSAVWTDADGDGDLDLVLSNTSTVSTPMTVYVQNSPEFVELRDNPWETDLTGVGAISLVDYDRDGDTDVFFGSYHSGQRPRFYRNEGTTYVNWAERFKFIANVGATDVTWLDFNNDQLMDMFVPGKEREVGLYAGTHIYGVVGLTPAMHCQGLLARLADSRVAQAVDADLDGWTDLFVIKNSGHGCMLLRNVDGANWNDIAGSVGLPCETDNERNNTVLAGSWADYDNDGDLDLALAQGNLGFHLFQNNLSSQNEYVALKLYPLGQTLPVAGCNVLMAFETSKQIGWTAQPSCMSGSDWSTILLASTASNKSDRVLLTIDWPDGARQFLNLDNLEMSALNAIHQPDPTQFTGGERALRRDPSGIEDYDISPNPFNPTTTISFTMGEAGPVELKFFNLMGQEVAAIAQETYSAGTHRILFNGADLPSGIYFSRLTAGTTTQLKRMFLAK